MISERDLSHVNAIVAEIERLWNGVHMPFEVRREYLRLMFRQLFPLWRKHHCSTATLLTLYSRMLAYILFSTHERTLFWEHEVGGPAGVLSKGDYEDYESVRDEVVEPAERDSVLEVFQSLRDEISLLAQTCDET